MCVYYTTVYVWITKEYRDKEKKNGKEMEVTRKSGRRPEPPRGWEGLGGAEIETVAMRTPEGHDF